MLKLLLKQKANLNKKTSNGSTPLLLAIYNNQGEIVKYLLKKYEKLYSSYPSRQDLIHIAAQYGSIKACKQLLKCNISIDQTNKYCVKKVKRYLI